MSKTNQPTNHKLVIEVADYLATAELTDAVLNTACLMALPVIRRIGATLYHKSYNRLETYVDEQDIIQEAMITFVDFVRRVLTHYQGEERTQMLNQWSGYCYNYTRNAIRRYYIKGKAMTVSIDTLYDIMDNPEMITPVDDSVMSSAPELLKKS